MESDYFRVQIACNQLLPSSAHVSVLLNILFTCQVLKLSVISYLSQVIIRVLMAWWISKSYEWSPRRYEMWCAWRQPTWTQRSCSDRGEDCRQMCIFITEADAMHSQRYDTLKMHMKQLAIRYDTIHIKSNHFYCHITTALVPWWVKFLRACSRQCKKKYKIDIYCLINMLYINIYTY